LDGYLHNAKAACHEAPKAQVSLQQWEMSPSCEVTNNRQGRFGTCEEWLLATLAIVVT